VIDEAYVDFGAETAIPLVASHPNLLVVQTMSKSRALAGLRVGYAIGDAGLIEALNRVKDSFNSYPLGRPAQAGAIAERLGLPIEHVRTALQPPSSHDKLAFRDRISTLIQLRKRI
jgi:histidinol-phosphate aminotransferase